MSVMSSVYKIIVLPVSDPDLFKFFGKI